MKNKDLYNIINEINSNNLFAEIESTNFSIALVKNIRKIEQEIEDLEKLRKQTEAYKEFLKEVQKIKLEFADKDENGKPIVKKEKDREYFVMTENLTEFEKKIEELQDSDKFKDVINDQKKRDEKFMSALDKECDISFKKIKESELPNNLKFKTVYFLDFMISD